MPCPGERSGKGSDVRWFRAPKPIDRLALVRHDPNVAARFADRAKQLGARKIHILVFINKNMLEATHVALNGRGGSHEMHCEPEKIAKIHRVRTRQLFFVDVVNLGDLKSALGLFPLLIGAGSRQRCVS